MEALYGLLHQCTARVSVPEKTVHGTGFFVAPGQILTCAHVVRDAQLNSDGVEVYWSSQSYLARLTKCWPEQDLAVIEVNLEGHPCVFLEGEVDPFDDLYSYGYPDDHPSGDPATFTLEGRTGNLGGQLKFKTGQVRPGLSGAPLLNVRTGRVCGIVELTRDRAIDLGGRGIPTTTVFEVFPELVRLQQQFHRRDRQWMKCLVKYLFKEHATIRQESRGRLWLLERAQKIWITDRLERSLGHADPIPLELHEQPEAISVSDPRKRNEPAQPLPLETPIADIYDETMYGQLLILGEPGTGKTTLLLELTSALLERAIVYDNQPVPVVFNLSSWAVKKQLITAWLVEELNNPNTYDIPRVTGRLWVGANQVLPLFDGLDEVASDDRAACIAAINTYLQEQRNPPTVVSCRSADYFAQPEHILLKRAVIVQSLTLQQIKDYLSRPGEQLKAVRQALQDDPDLQEVAKMPLMLNILTTHGMPIEGLEAKSSPEKLERKLFETYINDRLSLSRGPTIHYVQSQTRYWLEWLAYQLKEHNRTEFYIEQMQPSWLPKALPYRLYRLFQGLLFALFGGLAAGLIAALIFDLGGILAIALVCAMVAGLLSIGVTQILPAGVTRWSPVNMLRDVLEALVIGLVGTLLLGLVYYALYDKSLGTHIFGLQFELDLDLIYGIFAILIYALVGWLVDQFFNRIPSYHVQARPALIGVFIGLVVGLVELLIYDGANQLIDVLIHATHGGFVYDLTYGLVSGLLGGLLGGLLFGLGSGFSVSQRKPDEHKPIRPEQGMRRSARAGLRTGLIGGLGVGIFVGLIFWFLSGTDSGNAFISNSAFYLLLELLRSLAGPKLLANLTFNLVFRLLNALAFGSAFGLFWGLLIGLVGGGMAYIQHGILRLFLWRTNCVPLNYPRFLNYAADRMLLYKIGVGYTFKHELFRDYLATQFISPTFDELAEPEQHVL